MKAGTLAARATASADPPGVLVRTRLVWLWAEVAIEHGSLASEARAELLRAYSEGREAAAMKPELQEAMIAIAACAHSLDALYAELAEYVAPTTVAEWEQARRGGRWAEIAGLLALSVTADVEAWRARLRTLFTERRNPAVHPKAKAREPVRHPAIPVNVAAEYTIYCTENVEESLDLLFEVLTACVETPRTSIEAWAADSRTIIAQLGERRVELG